MDVTRWKLVVLIIVAILFILRYQPLLLLGSATVQSDVLRYRNTIQKPTLFVCTHDYEHVDMFVIAQETIKWKQLSGLETTIVVANKMHNLLYDRFVRKDANCLFVRKHTVRTVLKLLQTRHVCIFLYRHALGTGIYHMARKHANVLTVRIESNRGVRCDVAHDGVAACVYDTAFCTYDVSYNTFAAVQAVRHDVDPKVAFFHRLKHQMYAMTAKG